MFWLSRWTYSGVPGFGPAACTGGTSARARRAARRHMRPIAGIVTRWDATQNACVAYAVIGRRPRATQNRVARLPAERRSPNEAIGAQHAARRRTAPAAP